MSQHQLVPMGVIVSCTWLWLSCPAAAQVGDVLKVPADHKTVQAAIDAAKSGDTVLVAAGTYQERVKLKPGVTLRSAGNNEPGKLGLLRAEQTILDGGVDGKVPGVEMAEGAVLDGFTITRVGAYDDAAWNKHHATQGEEQSHNHIGEFGNPAVAITGVACTVTHCVVHHNGFTGIGIQGVPDQRCSPQVTFNVCYRNMGGGIGSMKKSTATIQDNTCFENFYAGIGHDNASPLVLNNNCYANIRAGIGISEGASPIVRGNKCYRNRRAGIGIRTTNQTRPIVEDNDCYENDMAGIGSKEEAQAIIRGNRCWKNKLAGIGTQMDAAPLIVGNECWENGMAGIGSRDGAQPIIVNNVSRKNATSGIGVRGTETRAIVIGNRCVDNKLVAVGLPDGAQALLIDNQLKRTGGMPPLVAIKGNARALLYRNQLRGGGVAGVLLQGTGLLIDNRLQPTGGRGSGVWVHPNSTALLKGNQIDGFRRGVAASGSQVAILSNTISGFESPAIDVSKPSEPAHVYGNWGKSDNSAANVAKVAEPHGVVAENRLVAPGGKSPK